MNDNKLSPQELGVDTAPYRGTSALERTMLDLGRSLRALGMNPTIADRADEEVRGLMGHPRSSPAMDAAVAKIDRGVKVTLQMIDEPYVRHLLDAPHLITRAVYGVHAAPIWPPAGKSPTRALADCRERQKALIGTGAADMEKVHQLRRAAAAIERIIAEEGAAP